MGDMSHNIISYDSEQYITQYNLCIENSSIFWSHQIWRRKTTKWKDSLWQKTTRIFIQPDWTTPNWPVLAVHILKNIFLLHNLCIILCITLNLKCSKSSATHFEIHYKNHSVVNTTWLSMSTPWIEQLISMMRLIDLISRIVYIFQCMQL